MATWIPGTGEAAFDAGGEREDQLFEALSHPLRRWTLDYLQRTEGAVSVDELTAELAAWESRRPVAERSTDSSAAIESALVHSHLPKMADTDLVAYDAAEGTVALADRTDEIRAQLQAMTTD